MSEANFRLNSIREIKTPLVSYQCLKVLNLDQNGLTSLEGLGALAKLQVLTASGNNLGSCGGLDSLSQLRVLDLSNNKIAGVAELSGLANLEILRLAQNVVESLTSADRLESLTVLDISDNKLRALEDFCSLSALHRLRDLRMEGNPCCLAMHSRLHVVKILTQLSVLDSAAVAAAEKIEAQNLHGADIDDLAAIRAEHFPSGELDDGGSAAPNSSTASACNAVPAGVNATPRGRRSNSVTPSSASSRSRGSHNRSGLLGSKRQRTGSGWPLIKS